MQTDRRGACAETMFSNGADVAANVLSWSYWEYTTAPLVSTYKAVTGGRHLTHICERWATDRTDGVQARRVLYDSLFPLLFLLFASARYLLLHVETICALARRNVTACAWRFALRRCIIWLPFFSRRDDDGVL